MGVIYLYAPLRTGPQRENFQGGEKTNTGPLQTLSSPFLPRLIAIHTMTADLHLKAR